MKMSRVYLCKALLGSQQAVAPHPDNSSSLGLLYLTKGVFSLEPLTAILHVPSRKLSAHKSFAHVHDLHVTGQKCLS